MNPLALPGRVARVSHAPPKKTLLFIFFLQVHPIVARILKPPPNDAIITQPRRRVQATHRRLCGVLGKSTTLVELLAANNLLVVSIVLADSFRIKLQSLFWATRGGGYSIIWVWAWIRLVVEVWFRIEFMGTSPNLNN